MSLLNMLLGSAFAVISGLALSQFTASSTRLQVNEERLFTAKKSSSEIMNIFQKDFRRLVQDTNGPTPTLSVFNTARNLVCPSLQIAIPHPQTPGSSLNVRWESTCPGDPADPPCLNTSSLSFRRTCEDTATGQIKVTEIPMPAEIAKAAFCFELQVELGVTTGVKLRNEVFFTNVLGEVVSTVQDKYFSMNRGSGAVELLPYNADLCL